MLFLKAVVMGLAIAAPLGPIGALCIQRTLARGFWAGAAGGLGTAMADALYAALAAAGFATFAATLARISAPLALFGGAFLLWLAWRGWPRGAATARAATQRAVTAPDPAARGLAAATASRHAVTAPETSAPETSAPAARGMAATTATTFALTLANPATILTFTAIFAGLGLAQAASGVAALAVVIGIFAGSMLWWILLAGSVAALSQRLPAGFALWVARLSSLMLGGFGLWALGSVLA